MKLLILSLLWITCGSFNNLTAQQIPRPINVKNFGAEGDGIHDDYSSFDKVLRISQPDQEIFVPAGTYLLTKGLVTYHDKTIIKLDSGAILSEGNNTNGMLQIRNKECEVTGGEFIGNGLSAKDIHAGFGIELLGTSNCLIQDIEFIHISGISILLYPMNSRIGCDNNKVINNTILFPALNQSTAKDGAGIMLGYSGNGYYHKRNLIMGNYIDGNETIGIGIGILAHGDSNTIENNTVKNCLRYGIIAYETSYVDSTLTRTYIINNLVENIGDVNGSTNNYGMGIYLMKSHYSVVKGNRIYNTVQNAGTNETLMRGAISDNGSIYCTIDSNFINNSGMYGIACAYCYNADFTQNKINNTKKDGIRLINTNDNIIEDNILTNVQQAGISGKFLNTTPYASQGFLTKYRNISTGRGIEIIDNEIQCNNKDGAIVLVGEKPNQGNHYQGNMVTDLKVSGNKINGAFNKADFIIIRNGQRNTKIKRNTFLH